MRLRLWPSPAFTIRVLPVSTFPCKLLDVGLARTIIIASEFIYVYMHMACIRRLVAVPPDRDILAAVKIDIGYKYLVARIFCSISDCLWIASLECHRLKAQKMTLLMHLPVL